ncbi:MAG TPA: hypothetical protein ENN43_05460 [bacterium]|nr:hypothetical protein [bacterium]
MKKALCVLSAAVLAFMALSSCSKEEAPTAPDSPEATLTMTYAITPAFTATPTTTPTPDAVQTAVEVRSFVSVPGGTFTQTDGSESFSHTISSFYIGKCQVTYELWYEVYQWAIGSGYVFANAGREGNNGGTGIIPTTRKYEPVTTINWRDMIVWCNAYSEMTGRTPVYYTNEEKTIPLRDSTGGDYEDLINTTPGSFDNPYVNWSANGYRLPTEGEWEYAARYINGSSWTPHNYASGATADYTDDTATGLVAWYPYNSGDVTHDVGGKNPNALGIYDMSGNVREWCWDWYESYPGMSADYKGPANGSYRTYRGGSFYSSPDNLQSGFRFYFYPYSGLHDLGFRLVRTQ